MTPATTPSEETPKGASHRQSNPPLARQDNISVFLSDTGKVYRILNGEKTASGANETVQCFTKTSIFSSGKKRELDIQPNDALDLYLGNDIQIGLDTGGKETDNIILHSAGVKEEDYQPDSSKPAIKLRTLHPGVARPIMKESSHIGYKLFIPGAKQGEQGKVVSIFKKLGSKDDAVEISATEAFKLVTTGSIVPKNDPAGRTLECREIVESKYQSDNPGARINYEAKVGFMKVAEAEAQSVPTRRIAGARPGVKV